MDFGRMPYGAGAMGLNSFIPGAEAAALNDPTINQQLKALFDSLVGKTKGGFQKAQGGVKNALNSPQATSVKGGASSLFNWLKANPAMGAGLGIAGAANIGGLFDNDKIGGQLGGGALGTAVPLLLNKFAGTALGPAGIALSGLSGGAIGSFYDKLRAAQEQEYMQSMSQQRQGGMY